MNNFLNVLIVVPKTQVPVFAPKTASSQVLAVSMVGKWNCGEVSLKDHTAPQHLFKTITIKKSTSTLRCSPDSVGSPKLVITRRQTEI